MIVLKRMLRTVLLTVLSVPPVLGSMQAEAAGRVPTGYNRRYQVIFAEQEMFRPRPELLACVYAAREHIQKTPTSVFNRLSFTPKSVQTAYVLEGIESNKVVRTIRISGTGRVRAYSFLENWEVAEIDCRFVSGAIPDIRLNIGNDD